MPKGSASKSARSGKPDVRNADVKSERTEVDKENKIYTRTIIVFDKIYDVAVVDFSAYDGISMQARSKEYFIDLEKDLQEKQRRKRLLFMTYL